MQDAPLDRLRPSSEVIVGMTVGIITIALTTVGLGRALDYDEAVTVGMFAKAPTAVDSVTRQVVFNNHPLISLLDHFDYVATGRMSEPAFRIIPIATFVIAASLIGYQLTK